MECIQRLVLVSVAIMILFAGIGRTVRGETSDLASIVESVQSRYEKTHFFQARFRQDSFLASLDETRQSTGRVFIRKPGMMRWEYESPERQLLVSDGVSFWVYTPELKQVVVSRFGEAFRSKTPLAFLAGYGDIRSEFTVRLREPAKGDDTSNADVYRLSLVPKTTHSGLRELRLEVRKDDFLIVRSTIVDPFGNITDIRFEKIRVDQVPPMAIFTFTIPPGIEVVKPPGVPGSSG